MNIFDDDDDDDDNVYRKVPLGWKCAEAVTPLKLPFWQDVTFNWSLIDNIHEFAVRMWTSEQESKHFMKYHNAGIHNANVQHLPIASHWIKIIKKKNRKDAAYVLLNDHKKKDDKTETWRQNGQNMCQTIFFSFFLYNFYFFFIQMLLQDFSIKLNFICVCVLVIFFSSHQVFPLSWFFFFKFVLANCRNTKCSESFMVF